MHIPLLTLLLTSVSAITVSYDAGYDDLTRSLSLVSCSDGTNGLLTKGYTTQGSLPTHYIGGTQFIAGYNDANCGTCWTLTYGQRSINVLAIDHTATGFNIAQTALDALTGGQAVADGRVDAAYGKEIPGLRDLFCGRGVFGSFADELDSPGR